MAYVPPAGNAVDFDFTDAAYLVPGGSVVIFDFGGGVIVARRRIMFVFIT